MSIELVSQVKLMTLLKHKNSGNYSLFQRMAELAGFEQDKANPFLHYNLFTAYSVCGIIEVSRSSSKTFWTATDHSKLKVNSRNRKIIPNKILSNSHPLVPFIIDESGKPIIIGSTDINDEDLPENCVRFSSAIWKLLPKEKYVHETCLDEERVFVDADKEVKLFDIEQKKWQPTNYGKLEKSGLIKYRKEEYLPESIYMVLQDLGIQFRVSESEWAFVIALRMLNWDIEDIIRISDGVISIPSSIRLPTIILRILFSEAKQLEVGKAMIFSGLDGACVNEFKDYILGA